MAVEVPSDRSRTRNIAIVVAVVVALVVAAGLVWAMISAEDDGGAKQTSIEPAQETTAQPVPAVPVATSTATPSVEPTTVAPEPEPAPAPASSVLASNRVAFVLGGRIYVANSDGSSAIPVAPSGGSYTLSPDGTRLAVAYDPSAQQTADGALAVFDAASGTMSPVGSSAFTEAPRWGPEGTWLVYTSGSETTSIKRVELTGATGPTLAKSGAMPRVSPQGEFIAYGVSLQPGPGDRVTIARTDGAGSAAVGSSGGALSWAWGPKGELYFSKQATTPDDWQLWVARPPRFKPKAVGRASLASPAYQLHGLMVSLDGKYVLCAAAGDDQYSRLMVYDVAKRRFSSISTRRDAYPYGWTPDGAILYFEGNVYQGEPSALMSIRSDGTGRKMVISGAQR